MEHSDDGKHAGRIRLRAGRGLHAPTPTATLDATFSQAERMPDWIQWLDQYDRPRSPLSQRLFTVQRLISKHLDATAPASVTVLSICAGDGRDIVDVLAEREDAARVGVTLIELEPHLCLLARARARRANLNGVLVRRADAGTTASYAGLARADLVILVGVFGNMREEDAPTTIAMLPALCAAEALVVWARRNEAEPVAALRAHFAAEGFAETYASRFNAVYHVGAHRLARAPTSLPANERFFAFRNDGAGGRP